MQVFSSFVLKAVAIVAMTCNHAAYIFADQLPFPAYCALEGVGGLTFPIMAYLMAEGWRHTSNINRYEMRLAVFALVAQVPFSLFLGMEGNVLITLFLGLLVLHLHSLLGFRPAWWIAAVAAAVASGACDWGFIGVVMIVLAGLLPTQSQQAAACGLLPMLAHGLPAVAALMGGDAEAVPVLLYAVGNGCAAALLCCYSGRRGRPLKWFFYVYYPLHIAVLGCAHLVVLGL